MKPSSRRSFFRRLLGHQRGSVTPLFLLSFTAILGTTMGGIDLVRYNVVQNRLQSSLDGATLSAGRNLQNRQMANMGDPESAEYQSWQDDAFGYFRSNMPANYLGNTIEPEDLKIEYSDVPLEGDGYTKGQFVSMQVEGTLPLISTGFLNVSSMKVRAENRAVRHTPADIELVMALDNTGSMSGNKITTLKKSAKELTNILFAARDDSKDTDTPRDITIGLVPFADTVNVGNTAKTRNWLYDYPAAQQYFIENNWSGCISEPLPAHWDNKNLPTKAWKPSDKVFMPLHLTYSFVLNRNTLGLTNDKHIIVDSTADQPQPRIYGAPDNVGSMGKFDRRVAATRNANRQFKIVSAANPSNCVASRASHFLSGDQDTILDAISDMSANGSTIIPTGLLWAWRMLDPNWKNAWDDSGKPMDTNVKGLRKVIVLLTDGKNEPSGAIGSVSNSNRSAFRLTYDICTDQTSTCSNPTEKTYISKKGSNNYYQSDSISNQNPMNSLRMRDPDLDQTSTSSIGHGNDNKITNATTDTYLKALCPKVRGDGNYIKIYTITLGDVGGATETMMNDCSSGAGYNYNTKNANDLPQVFRSIASAMVELRLTK